MLAVKMMKKKEKIPSVAMTTVNERTTTYFILLDFLCMYFLFLCLHHQFEHIIGGKKSSAAGAKDEKISDE